MREIRQSGSEGGELQYNATSLPLSLFQVDGTWNVPTTFLQEFTQQRAQVGGAATVTPFVVIPRYNLDQLALVPQDLCEVRGENAAVRIVDDVARNDWVFGVAQNPLEWSLGCQLHGCIDFGHSCFLLEVDCQVDDRTGCDRNSHCNPRQLALEFGNDQAHCGCCTRGGRDNV